MQYSKVWVWMLVAPVKNSPLPAKQSHLQGGFTGFTGSHQLKRATARLRDSVKRSN